MCRLPHPVRCPVRKATRFLPLQKSPQIEFSSQSPNTLVYPLAPTPYTESRPKICNFSRLDRAYNAFNYVLQLSNEASWQPGLGFGYKWSKTTLPPYRILEMDPVRGTSMFLSNQLDVKATRSLAKIPSRSESATCTCSYDLRRRTATGHLYWCHPAILASVQ